MVLLFSRYGIFGIALPAWEIYVWSYIISNIIEVKLYIVDIREFDVLYPHDWHRSYVFMCKWFVYMWMHVGDGVEFALRNNKSLIWLAKRQVLLSNQLYTCNFVGTSGALKIVTHIQFPYTHKSKAVYYDTWVLQFLVVITWCDIDIVFKRTHDFTLSFKWCSLTF